MSLANIVSEAPWAVLSATGKLSEEERKASEDAGTDYVLSELGMTSAPQLSTEGFGEVRSPSICGMHVVIDGLQMPHESGQEHVSHWCHWPVA